MDDMSSEGSFVLKKNQSIPGKVLHDDSDSEANF